MAVPLAMLNRHGLVAGATGTGKTKTVQGLAGRLSDAGVPCFVADLKGDVSGMAEPVAWTRLYPPLSRLAPADPATVQRVLAGSAVHGRHAKTVDPDSAYERLTARMQQAQAEEPIPAPKGAPEP